MSIGRYQCLSERNYGMIHLEGGSAAAPSEEAICLTLDNYKQISSLPILERF